MKRIYKIMRDKKGEGYIDAAVVVFCVMFVIALGVRIFPVFITKIQLDNFADELVWFCLMDILFQPRDFPP